MHNYRPLTHESRWEARRWQILIACGGLWLYLDRSARGADRRCRSGKCDTTVRFLGPIHVFRLMVEPGARWVCLFRRAVAAWSVAARSCCAHGELGNVPP